MSLNEVACKGVPLLKKVIKRRSTPQTLTYCANTCSWQQNSNQCTAPTQITLFQYKSTIKTSNNCDRFRFASRFITMFSVDSASYYGCKFHYVSSFSLNCVHVYLMGFTASMDRSIHRFVNAFSRRTKRH